MIIKEKTIIKIAEEMSNDIHRAIKQTDSFVNSEPELKKLIDSTFLTIQFFKNKESIDKEKMIINTLNNFAYTLFRCFLEANNLEIKNKKEIKK